VIRAPDIAAKSHGQDRVRRRRHDQRATATILEEKVARHLPEVQVRRLHGSAVLQRRHKADLVRRR
jgi:hypothetical protein